MARRRPKAFMLEVVAVPSTDLRAGASIATGVVEDGRGGRHEFSVVYAPPLTIFVSIDGEMMSVDLADILRLVILP